MPPVTMTNSDAIRLNSTSEAPLLSERSLRKRFIMPLIADYPVLLKCAERNTGGHTEIGKKAKSRVGSTRADLDDGDRVRTPVRAQSRIGINRVGKGSNRDRHVGHVPPRHTLGRAADLP